MPSPLLLAAALRRAGIITEEQERPLVGELARADALDYGLDEEDAESNVRHALQRFDDGLPR